MKKLGITTAFKLLWKISNKRDRTIFVLLSCSCLLRALADLLPPLVTACVIAKLSGNKASILFITFPSSMSNIALVLTAFAIVFATAMLGTVIRAGVKLFGTHMSNVVNHKGLEYVLEYRKNFNLNITNGEISYIIKTASEQTFNLINEFLIKVLSPILVAIIAMVYIASANIFSGIIIIGTIVVMSLLIWFRIYNDKKIFKKLEVINGKLNNHALNNIENLPFVGFLKTKSYELEILGQLNKEYFKNEKKKTRTYLLYWLGLYLVEFACTIGVILLILSNSSINFVDTLVVIIPYTLNIFTSTENLAFIIGNCQQYSIKISRLLMLKAKPENLILLADETMKLPKETTIEKISIENLTFEIGDFKKQFDNVNFYKGKINCLAGGSGSGKTSLINCLLGLKEYNEGEILINDKFKVKSLFFENERISISFQGENFFDRPLNENIMYPNSELNQKAKELINYFELDEVIQRETDINQTFKNTLSGGEKKRFNFIRCLAKDAEVYILDEPTNELDEKNVKRVVDKIIELKESALVIVISHDKRLLSVSENIINLA